MGATSSQMADSVVSRMRREIDATAADCGMGTVTALTPGGVAGTVAVQTTSSTPISMRRAAGYTPTVGDKVWWLMSRRGDYFVVDKLA